MSRAIALIQGASRGLGFEFAKQLSCRPNTTVLAACRNPESWSGLQALGDNVEPIRVDVTEDAVVKEAADLVKQRYGKLDLLINVSGILHPSGRGETQLKAVTMEGLESTFRVNAFGPLVMAKHFAPLLQQGGGLVGKGAGHAGVLVNMSARVGSISDNGLGGWYSYRMSKAALNMANKCLSIEFGRGRKKIICLCLHPGTVDTDLSRPYHKNVPNDKLFTTEYSVTKLLEIIDGASAKDSGRYVAWDGQDIPF